MLRGSIVSRTLSSVPIFTQKCRIGSFTPIEERVVPEIPTPSRIKHRIRLYLWGGSLTGALGKDEFVRPLQSAVKPKSHCSSPQKLMFSEVHKIRDVACGNGFTVVACRHDTGKHKFQVFGTGINTDSQIGLQCARRDAPLELLTELVPIDFPCDPETRVVKVAAGRAHTLLLTNKKEVYSLGNNSLGQCGRNIDDNETYFGRSVLRRVEIPEAIEKIYCGLDHSFFLSPSGNLYACGWGADGQTGLGHYENVGVPQKVNGDISQSTIVDVSCSADCVLAIDNHGGIFGWGNNEYGQILGLPRDQMQLNTPRRIPLDKKIRRVAAGGTSCVVLDDEGEVYSWGYGILGVGPEVQQSLAPLHLPPTLFGRNELNPESKVVSVIGGLNDFAAITSQGFLYTWGRNRNGSLGLRHCNPQLFPMRVYISAEVKSVSIGVDHMAAITQTLC